MPQGAKSMIASSLGRANAALSASYYLPIDHQEGARSGKHGLANSEMVDNWPRERSIMMPS